MDKAFTGKVLTHIMNTSNRETNRARNDMAYKESFISYDYDEFEDAYVIDFLWVHVDDRRQGKGRKMLQDAIAEMQSERKASKVMLSADSDNMDPENPIDLADLVDFYESEGFEVICCEGHGVIMEMDI